MSASGPELARMDATEGITVDPGGLGGCLWGGVQWIPQRRCTVKCIGMFVAVRILHDELSCWVVEVGKLGAFMCFLKLSRAPDIQKS